MATVSNRGTKERPLWYCRYKDVDGKRKHRPTGQTTKAAAVRFAAELEARIHRGTIGIPEPTEEELRAKTMTVGELAARFLKEYDPPRLKDRKHYMVSCAAPMVNARLLPYPLARMAAVTVKKIDVVHYRDALRKKYKHSTVNTTLAYLHRIFAWAIDSEIIDCRNPCSKVERMPTTPSEVFYTREQCARLLGPDCDPKVATALLTGMRHGELCGLRWCDVRYDLGCIQIRRSFLKTPKNGKPRTIPLHSDLVPVLRAWQARCPETAGGWCFPVEICGKHQMAGKQDARKVRPLLLVAGCPSNFDHPWHAMRHTFATLLAESGASPDAISRIMGHSDSGNRITAGYTHLAVEFLSRELEKLRLLPGQPANVLRIADYRHTA